MYSSPDDAKPPRSAPESSKPALTLPFRLLDDTKVKLEPDDEPALQKSDAKPTVPSTLRDDTRPFSEANQQFYQMSQVPYRHSIWPSENQIRDPGAHRPALFNGTTHLGGGNVFEHLRQQGLIVGSDSHMNPIPNTGPPPDIISSSECWQRGLLRMLGGHAREPPNPEGEDQSQITERRAKEAVGGVKKEKQRNSLPRNMPRRAQADPAVLRDGAVKRETSPIIKVEEEQRIVKVEEEQRIVKVEEEQ